MTMESAPLPEESPHVDVDSEVMNPTPGEVALGALSLQTSRPVVRGGRRGSRERSDQENDASWGGGEFGWRGRAKCNGKDVNLFFSDNKKDRVEAMISCLRCEVSEECLGYALESEQGFGIWGGLGEDDRRRLRRKQ